MMFFFHVVLVTFVFASFVDGGVISPHRSGSDGDQYRGREGAEGNEHPQVEMARFHGNDATDRELALTKGTQRNPLLAIEDNSNSSQPNKTHQDTAHPSSNDSEQSRNKRSYYPYSALSYQVPQFQSLSSWSPSYYPLQHPYYIPVYGVDGRIPIYLPPRPLYLNPGTPPQNPGKPPYVGPTYLPPVTPVTPATPENDTTTMPTENKFGGNDDDDRPIWDNGNEPAVPPSGTPTRKPPTSGRRTFPPLVHKDTNNINHLAAEGSVEQPPSTSAPSQKRPPGPSRCVWAIVSCCSTSSKEVSYNCFDQLGCSGPFWDVSPCETEYAKAAIASALNYYNTRS